MSTDFLGNSLNVGDSIIVVDPNYKKMSKQIVTKITPLGVTYEKRISSEYYDEDSVTKTNRPSGLVLKDRTEELTKYIDFIETQDLWDAFESWEEECGDES